MSELTPREVALAGQVERLARQLDELRAAQEARVGKVEEAMGHLTQAIAMLARRAAGPACGSWLWPAVPEGQQAGPAGPPLLAPDVARAVLLDLAAWLDRVYLRYSDAALSSCWAWHPEVIEELLWLRAAHAEAYEGPQASAMQAGTWHDRLRPGVVRRVGKVLGRCDLTAHRAGGTANVRPLGVPLSDQLTVVAGAWAHHEQTPEPTASAIEAADRHARATAARRRGGGGSS